MRFASLAEQAQTLAGQAQALHAADKKPALIAAAEEEQAQTLADAEQTIQPDQPEEAKQQDPEPQRKRRTFWQWLAGE